MPAAGAMRRARREDPWSWAGRCGQGEMFGGKEAASARGTGSPLPPPQGFACTPKPAAPQKGGREVN